MRDVVALVFDKHDTAVQGLHELWRLDGEGELTVHGAGLAFRDSDGGVVFSRGDGDLPMGLAVGLTLGALLGVLAGPAGAAVGAARGAVVGAATGGAVGLGVDASNAGTLEQALDESGMVLRKGQHAVIADVDEDAYAPLDSPMKTLGAKIYRRPKSEIANDMWKGLNPYLVPYDYHPVIAADHN